MPLSRFNKLPAEKQNEILDVAAAELAARGFESAVLGDVLDRAGLSKSSFYYYFEDREDLLATVLERLVAQRPRLLALGELEDATAEDFWGGVKRAFDVSEQLFNASPGMLRLLSEVLALEEKNARIVALRARATEDLRSVLRIGKRLGCVRDDIDLELLVEVSGAVHGVIRRAIARAGKSLDPKPLRGHFALMFDLFQRLARAEPVRSSGRAKK